MSTRSIADGIAGKLAAPPTDPATVTPDRKLTQSAPDMSQHRLQAEVLQAVLDTQIDELIDELRNMPADLDTPSPAAPPASTQAAAEDDSQLDQLIGKSFDDHLELVQRMTRPEPRARVLHAAVTLLSVLEPQKRAAARDALAACVAAQPDALDADRVLARLIDDFISAHTDTPHASTAEHAIAFAKTLAVASADLPFVSKCKLLVMQLWAATRLETPAMASACTAAFVEHVSDDDPEIAARRICKAATYLDVMPMKFSLVTAKALYQCVPAASPWQLQTLEALAVKDTLFAPTAESRDFFKTLHQRIYELRLLAADD